MKTWICTRRTLGPDGVIYPGDIVLSDEQPDWCVPHSEDSEADFSTSSLEALLEAKWTTADARAFILAQGGKPPVGKDKEKWATAVIYAREHAAVVTPAGTVASSPLVNAVGT